MKHLLSLALMFSPGLLRAEIVTASLDQQAEIIMHIEKARHATDLTEDAHGNRRNSSYYNAAMNKRDLERAMGIPFDAQGNPLRQPTEKDLNKISGGWFGRDRRGDYAQAAREFQAARQKSLDEFDRALELTVSYYNIKPLPQFVSGTVVNGPPWERGKYLAWSPKFSDKPQPDESGLGEAGYRDAKKNRPAFIREDGQVILRDEAFFDNSGRPSPGALASLVYHEHRHVVDSLTPESWSKDLRNIPATEMYHRLAELTKQEIFELPAYDWKQNLKNLAWQNELATKWQNAIAVGKDPYNLDDRQRIFDQLSIPAERTAEIDRQVENDLVLMAAADSGDVAAFERLKAQAQSDFWNYISDDSMKRLVGGWKRAREVDALRNQRERELSAQQMKHEILRCGFEPRYSGAGVLYGFRHSGAGMGASFTTPRYAPLEETLSMDQLKVSILLLRACWSAMRGEAIPGSCNEGLDVSNRFWTAPGFTGPLIEGGSEHQCMAYLRDRWAVPMDEAALHRLLEPIIKAVKESNRRRNDNRDDDRDRRPGGDDRRPPESPNHDEVWDRIGPIIGR